MPNYTNSVFAEDSETAPRHERLKGQHRFDVAVIGGGISGITTALLLKEAGQRVAVIESRRVGKGETNKTTAHLTEVFDQRYHQLISRFGEDGARAANRSQRDAIACIAGLVDRLQISCAFTRVPGYLYCEDASGVTDLQSEADACGQLGIDAALDGQTPLPFAVASSLCFRNQAQFQPRDYLLALAAAVSGGGCAIFEDSHVTHVDDGEPCRVHTVEGEIICDRVVVTTNVPITHVMFFPTKIPAYRTYAVAVTTQRPLGALCWDTAEPYHYLRDYTRADGSSLLILGGEDHKTGQEEDTHAPFRRLEDYVRRRFGDREIVNHWSGQIIESLDGLPYIGRTVRSVNVFVATGYAGQGMTMGTLAGMLLSDLILARKNPYADLYRPSRIKPFTSAGTFVRENVDFPTHVVADRLRRRPNGAGIESLPPGEGAVLTLEGKRLAVYRDHAGHLSAVSPVCTHMGCLVQWNSTEKSWDCPCHGSRFEPTGRVLNGPAITALPARELPDYTEVPGPEEPAAYDEEGAPRHR